MCTKVSCCVDWASMSRFTCSLILLTSFVVAVPVSHLRALPKKGSRLLLRWLLLFICPSNEGSVFRRLIAEIMVGLQELYISLIGVSSTCCGDIEWVGAARLWLRNCNSWCVLSTCLLKYFQWCSMCPSDTCAVIIHEWHVGYAFQNWLKKNWFSYFSCRLRQWWGLSYIRCCDYDECQLFTVLNVWVIKSVNH